MKIWILPFLLLGSQLSAAPTNQSSSSLVMHLQEIDRITFQGERGDIKWIFTEGAKELSIKAKLPGGKKIESVVSAKRNGRELQILIQVPESSDDLAKQSHLRREELKQEFEIRSPSLPVDVAWTEGSVTAVGSNSFFSVMLLKGKVQVEKMAEVKLNARDGVLNASEIKGPLTLETYSGQIDAKDLAARTRIRNFSGKTAVSKFAAPLSFESYKGALNASQGKGAIDFKTQNGSIVVQDLEGDLAGSSEQGSITAKLKGRAVAKLETATGAIRLSVPSDSGARLSIQSDDGHITLPRNFDGPPGNGKSAYGHLVGETAGSLVLRTKTGEIKVETF